MGVGTMRTLVAAAVITLALVGHAAAQGGARELQQSSSTCSPGRVDKYFYLEIGAATCNFYRPGNVTERGPNAFRLGTRTPTECILVNGTFPGPPLRVTKGDVVRVDVMNTLIGRSINVHWHGFTVEGTPWADGTAMVNSCPIMAGQAQTHIFRATKAGTYFYHGHGGFEEEYGLSGAFIVDDPANPFADLYDEEAHDALEMRDWWWTPDAHASQALSFRFYQQMAPYGVPLFNGAYGDGTDALPYPVTDLAANTCYRLRFVCGNTEWPGWFVNINDPSGNPVNITVLALMAQDLRPFNTRKFAFYIAQRLDAVVCTGAPGIYTMTMNSSQPEDGYCTGGTPNCINGMTIQIRVGAINSTAPKTANRARLASLPYLDVFDSLKHPEQVIPYEPVVVPERPTHTWNLYSAIVPGNMYLWTERNWGLRMPSAPPLFTRGGRCGIPAEPLSGQVPNATYNKAYLHKTVQYGDVVDIIFNNLSPFFHPMHMHGYDFVVLGSRYYMDAGYTNVSGVPQNSAGTRIRAPEDVCPNGYMWAVPSYDGTAGPPWPTRTPAGTPFSSFAFGCPRNPSADNSQYYTSNPYKTDIVPLPPHGWAHVRIRVTNPGVWFLHCHLNIHMLNGMGFIVHAALDRVPRIPSWVDTSCMGTCQALDQGCGPYAPERHKVPMCSRAPETCPPTGGTVSTMRSVGQRV